MLMSKPQRLSVKRRNWWNERRLRLECLHDTSYQRDLKYPNMENVRKNIVQIKKENSTNSLVRL